MQILPQKYQINQTLNLNLSILLSKLSWQVSRSLMILLILLFNTQVLLSQDGFILTGKFKIDGGSNSGAKISIIKDGKKVNTLEGTSRFEIKLDFQAIYMVAFEKEGFVTKRLRFDTHVPEARASDGFYPFDFTVEIFEQLDGVNTVVFNQPVGQISYSEVIDEFDYDTDYTKSIQSQIEQAIKENEEKKEEQAKQKEEEAKQQESLNKEISSLSLSANKNMSAGKIAEAIEDIESALALKKTPGLELLLQEAMTILAENKKKEEQKGALEAKLDEAGKALAAGDLENAKRLYEDANGILSSDPRAQKQIAIIEKQIADKKANEQKVSQLQKEAEEALAAGNPESALSKAKELETIGGGETAKKLVAQANDQIKAKEAAANAAVELQKQLETVLSDASKALKAGDVELAEKKIEEAKSLSSEAPIGDLQAQIEETKKAQVSAKAEEEKKLKDFNALIEESNKALAAGNLDGAKAAMEKAKAIFDNDALSTLAKAILESEERIKKEAGAKAEQEQKIKDLISSTSSEISEGNIEKAKESLASLKDLKADAAEIANFEKQIASKGEELLKFKENAEKIESLKKEIEDHLKNADIGSATNAIKTLSGLGETEASSKFQSELDKLIADKADEEAAKLEQTQKIEKLLSDAKGFLSDEDVKGLTSAIKEIEKQDPANAEIASLKSSLATLESGLEARKAEETKAAEEAKILSGYKEEITKADEAFAQKDYSNAKKLYASAKSIKQDETYPDDKLLEIVKQEESLSNAEKEAAEAAAKAASEARINELLVQANAFIASQDSKGLSEIIKSLEKEDPANSDLSSLKESLASLETNLESRKEEEAKAAELAKVISDYKEAISKADQAFAEKDYLNAKKFYAVAKSIKQDEVYPEEKLAELLKLEESVSNAEKEASETAAKKEKESKITELIAQAKSMLEQKNIKGLDSSLKNLEKEDSSNPELLELKSALAGLEKELANGDKAQEEEKQKAQQLDDYNSKISKAEKFLASGKLTEAKIAFQEAKSIKVDESYPDEKLKEIEKLESSQSEAANLAAQEKLKEDNRIKFDEFIEVGKKSLAEGEINSSIKSFQAAKDLNVDNSKADELIKDAEKRLSSELASKESGLKEEDFKKAMQKAQQSLTSADFDTAITEFNAALVLKPSDKEALAGIEKAKLAKSEADAILNEKEAKEAEEAAKKKKLEDDFNDIVKKGDELVGTGDLEGAKAKFVSALKLKDDMRVKAKIAAVDQRIASKKISNTTTEAAESLAKTNGEREKSQLAQIIEEESTKPESTEVVVAQATAEQEKRPESTQTRMAQPVLEQESRTSSSASVEFGQVKVGDKANESSPSANMTDEDKFDAQQELAKRQKVEFELDEEQKALKLKYPNRKTIEKMTVGTSIITYVYINTPKRMIVYKKVEHNWGGVYYFIDDKSTSQRFWEYETR